MLAIHFQPTAWESTQNKPSDHQVTFKSQRLHDSFGYTNPPEKCKEKEERKTLLERIAEFFKPKQTDKIPMKKSLTECEALEKAKRALKETLSIKKEVEDLILRGKKSNWEGCVTNKFGILVSFEKNELGNYVMIEHGIENEPTRTTTFSSKDLHIISIQEKKPNSSKYNKIVFFWDGKEIQVSKGVRETSNGDEKIDALYTYIDEEPREYQRRCTITKDAAIAKEVYYF